MNWRGAVRVLVVGSPCGEGEGYSCPREFSQGFCPAIAFRYERILVKPYLGGSDDSFERGIRYLGNRRMRDWRELIDY